MITEALPLKAWGIVASTAHRKERKKQGEKKLIAIAYAAQIDVWGATLNARSFDYNIMLRSAS